MKQNDVGSVVAQGGWYALECEASKALAERNFNRLRPFLPSSLDVVQTGGWSTVQALAADPKGALLQLADQALHGSTETLDGIDRSHLPAIAALLQAQGKGFDSDLVDGDWTLVLRQKGNAFKGQNRLRLLNWLLKREKPGKQSTSRFDVSKMEFYGSIKLWKFLTLSSIVKYKPIAEQFEKISNSIVLRRVMCNIKAALIKVWKLPALYIPLPTRGYLDFLYLDKELRVTKGNRGSLFVHVRPDSELVESLA